MLSHGRKQLHTNLQYVLFIQALVRWSPGLLQLPGTLQRGRGGRQTENLSQVGRCGGQKQVKVY